MKIVIKQEKKREILEIIGRIIFIYIFRFAGTVIATTIIARPGLSLLSNITLHQGNCIYDLAQPRIRPEKCRWRKSNMGISSYCVRNCVRMEETQEKKKEKKKKQARERTKKIVSSLIIFLLESIRNNIVQINNRFPRGCVVN